MSNSKRVRDQLLKQAGAIELPNGKLMMPWRSLKGPTCFTCKSCWRRSLQSDLNNLQCPFCGGNMAEVQK